MLAIRNKKNKFISVKKTAGGLIVFVAVLIVGAGCQSVPAHEQAKLTKPNMTFSEDLAFDDSSRILGNIEPGSVDASGSNGTGCAACK